MYLIVFVADALSTESTVITYNNCKVYLLVGQLCLFLFGVRFVVLLPILDTCDVSSPSTSGKVSF